MDAALVAIFQLHMEQPLGDFLVFMTGQEEIVNLNKLVEDYARQLPPQCPKLLVCPLYAKLPTEQQSQIFQPTPPGTRKVILATNIAETSITISGIRYVIDTGMTKVRAINPRTGIDTLAVQPISKASARQRMGRAGREAPGFCYRLYPEEAFNSLPEDIEPEILRCSLSSVTLMLKASGVDDVINFDYMDKPDRQSIVRALEELYALGCLNDKGNLTSLGKRMASLPLEPVFSKMLLNSVEYNCTSEVISIIAMLSVDVIFSAPANARETAAAAKSKFVNHDGDHLTLLNVLKSYLSVNRSQSWCAENFLSHRSLKQVLDIRQQLVEIAQRLDIDTEKECAEDEFENVTMCLLSGAFMNVAVKLPGGSSFKTLGSGQEVWIHPSSVLFGKKVGAVVYTELVSTVSLDAASWFIINHFIPVADENDQTVHAQRVGHTARVASKSSTTLLLEDVGYHQIDLLIHVNSPAIIYSHETSKQGDGLHVTHP
ncbi:P-loop containing nucleoside triphosphate hydrolase protein [Gaertneriomyces semiglobifer]|nr:P-loop containing nucleoside triphosphate hydrolase protein [Gaertneriomyces semiglobifer]